MRKTKYMIASRNEDRWANITNISIANSSFDRVRSFTYLGSVITENSTIGEEIREHPQVGNKCYWALLPLLKSQHLSKKGSGKIYKTVIKPVVTYAAETWCMLRCNKLKIAAWERKILRKIYRPKYENDEQSIRTNKELYGGPQNVSSIKSARL